MNDRMPATSPLHGDAVAALLGFPDSDDLLTLVSSSARTVAYALDSTMRRAGQSQRARTLRVGPRRPHLRSLGYGVYEHDGEAVLSGVRTSDPLLPLRTAAVAAGAGLPLAPQTLTNLAEADPLPTPWPPLARELFTDLLAAGPGLIPVWEGLHSVGIIDRWLPEWAAVDSRPQRNAVHRHTVDRHLLETVVEAGTLVRDVARPDLLLLSALLHDIGKVAGAHDHSHQGAGIAAGVVARLGLDEADATRRGLGVRADRRRCEGGRARRVDRVARDAADVPGGGCASCRSWGTGR